MNCFTLLNYYMYRGFCKYILQRNSIYFSVFFFNLWKYSILFLCIEWIILIKWFLKKLLLSPAVLQVLKPFFTYMLPYKCVLSCVSVKNTLKRRFLLRFIFMVFHTSEREPDKQMENILLRVFLSSNVHCILQNKEGFVSLRAELCCWIWCLHFSVVDYWFLVA